MKQCIITFRSVTPAQRAEQLLRQQGIDCVLQRTPRNLERQGCGYCLRLRLSQLARAAGLLQQNGIAFRRLYRLHGDERVEELHL